MLDKGGVMQPYVGQDFPSGHIGMNSFHENPIRVQHVL